MSTVKLHTASRLSKCLTAIFTSLLCVQNVVGYPFYSDDSADLLTMESAERSGRKTDRAWTEHRNVRKQTYSPYVLGHQSLNKLDNVLNLNINAKGIVFRQS